jgi:hypothetical protein
MANSVMHRECMWMQSSKCDKNTTHLYLRGIAAPETATSRSGCLSKGGVSTTNAVAKLVCDCPDTHQCTSGAAIVGSWSGQACCLLLLCPLATSCCCFLPDLELIGLSGVFCQSHGHFVLLLVSA